VRDQILITGGTGKTGRRVAEVLRERGVEPLVASGSARGSGEIRFDWADSHTYDAALSGVRAIYLLAPSNTASDARSRRKKPRGSLKSSPMPRRSRSSGPRSWGRP
jgi:uncharacterized protein YbjT (DUF2867 family)